MRAYRAYLIDKDDHIHSHRVIDADNDDRALEVAKQYVDGLDVEIWDGARKIARLSKD
jgi:hypothetical protein